MPNLGFGVPGLLPGTKDDTPNTNNYSNNTFKQTIVINPQASTTPVSPLAFEQPSNFGLTVPVHPQASLSAAMLQSQMMAPYLQYNPMLFSPQYYMPQYGAYMPQMVNQEEDDQDFDNDMTDEQQQLMAVFEMFKDTLLQEHDDVEQAIQEQEFEMEQAEAEVFRPELQDCQCCRGYPLKCQGDICANLGTCHCALRKTKEEEEANKDKFFVEEHRDCNCCRGFVYACTGAACKISGRCKCDDD